jgi:hypothetical protein
MAPALFAAGTAISIGANTGTTTVNNNLTVNGNLDVKGTITTVESTTITVADKNIELGNVASPTNTTADGGGITLHGTTDKTLNWVSSTASWTSSENFDLASGKTYKINGTDVLSSTALGSGVTGSSLTSVGTITSGVWQGSTIDNAYLTHSSIKLNGSTLSLGTTSYTIKAVNPSVLTIGTGLTGTSYDGASAVTIAIDSSVVATHSYISGLNYITLTSLSTGTPNAASGSGAISYSNTTGVFTYTPPDLSIYLTGSSTLSAGNLTGTIPSSVLGNSTVYVGTTAVALNRASGSINLTGTSIDGNAGTATVLQTARKINNVSFDGSQDITVTAAAGTLTGDTLNSSVTKSSLTQVGTLTNLTVTNTITGSITGNAGTVTNGVYTTGSYADPSWLTSLAYSKLTGAPTNVSTFTNDANYITTGNLSVTTNTPGTESLTYTGGVFTFTPYKLPTASRTVLGGVKVDGTTVVINNGVISSIGSGAVVTPVTASFDYWAAILIMGS